MLFAPVSSSDSAIFTSKYRPRKVADFIGLDKPKERMLSLIARPKACAWLYVGPSGVGKTTMALALADELNAELMHISSQKCTVDAVDAIKKRVSHMPMAGRDWHLVLVDEADSMSGPAQDAFLSLLDETARPARTIFIFTANETDTLKVRFKSRCFQLDFSSWGVAKDATEMLARVWSAEASPASPAPNFARIVKEANNNIRTALMELEQLVA
jgi:replication-associated recombination protein RarA